MADYPHVALIVATSKQYDRGLLRGIGRYIKGHGPWSVYIEERVRHRPAAELAQELEREWDHRADQRPRDGRRSDSLRGACG